MKNNERYTKLLIIITTLLCLMGGYAYASAGLAVTPARMDLNLTPGTNYTGTINIHNPKDEALDIHVTPFTEHVNNNYELYTTDGPAKWTTLDKNSFKLGPGETEQVGFKINVPGDVEFHDMKLVLSVQAVSNKTTPNQGMNAQQGLEICIPLNMALPGPIQENITLQKSNVPWIIFSCIPTTFEYSLENNGTTKESVNCQLENQGLTQNITQSNMTFYPDDSKNVVLNWTPNLWSIGPYHTNFTGVYGDFGEKYSIKQSNNVFVIPTPLLLTILIGLFWCKRRAIKEQKTKLEEKLICTWKKHKEQ